VAVLVVGVGVALLVGSSFGAPALAAPGAAKLKGQILASDQPVPTLDDEDKVADTLRKWQKGTIEKAKDSPSWSFHIVSFPEKKPGASTLTLVFTDVSGGKAKFLTSKDIAADANAEIIATDVEVDGEDGIQPGMKVDLTLARVIGNKQVDLARAKLVFK
jgi:hypothetical protein